MSRTLLSIDLDYLNGIDCPLDKLSELLTHVPTNTPAVMTVEHHEFLPHLRKWIKSGEVMTPFNIVNLDEHHDYYVHAPPHDKFGTEINCGVWGYRLPLEWYERYTWVYNDQSELRDWNEAELWLSEAGIHFSKRLRHRLGELKSEIVAAVFCVSPDYLECSMWDKISEAVEIVVRHFNLPRAPLKIKKARIGAVDGWRIAPRPLKVSKYGRDSQGGSRPIRKRTNFPIG